VQIDDQFGERNIRIGQPRWLCGPTRKVEDEDGGACDQCPG
jgi:hypothetical protein